MSNINPTFANFLKNWIPPVIEEPAPKEIRTIKEGDILVAQWGYEANNVNYFKVLKRTAKFVEVAELDAERVPGDPGIYMGIYVQPGTTWKRYCVFAKNSSFPHENAGQPIRIRRMVKQYADGSEYALLTDYADMHLWNGKPQVDYNHH